MDYMVFDRSASTCGAAMKEMARSLAAMDGGPEEVDVLIVLHAILAGAATDEVHLSMDELMAAMSWLNEMRIREALFRMMGAGTVVMSFCGSEPLFGLAGAI